jgi:UDP-N-acetylmuramoyl-L-alanyl-D-glutamate--2,6-diaminopimelate ligase
MKWQYSDLAIFTSDNPRTEDPEAILDDMTEHLAPSDRWMRITDRTEAIHRAVEMAKQGDYVLIAGKGHEDYQEINDVKHPFDDKKVFSSYEIGK